jgi:hypothetical protein
MHLWINAFVDKNLCARHQQYSLPHHLMCRWDALSLIRIQKPYVKQHLLSILYLYLPPPPPSFSLLFLVIWEEIVLTVIQIVMQLCISHSHFWDYKCVTCRTVRLLKLVSFLAVQENQMPSSKVTFFKKGSDHHWLSYLFYSLSHALFACELMTSVTVATVCSVCTTVVNIVLELQSNVFGKAFELIHADACSCSFKGSVLSSASYV